MIGIIQDLFIIFGGVFFVNCALDWANNYYEEHGGTSFWPIPVFIIYGLLITFATIILIYS